ncbi:hypothetical protein Y1Q_0016321 [Alligator mississippiensis]|uniref:Uncharacterized protein n=1 Tax=Alligator mississippiensis TaxID=8496 RepID=A0A151N2R3_ALLMI|nr:hypothetical protein Y1Q_0016321 [Alligator mississippiensis]
MQMKPKSCVWSQRAGKSSQGVQILTSDPPETRDAPWLTWRRPWAGLVLQGDRQSCSHAKLLPECKYRLQLRLRVAGMGYLDRTRLAGAQGLSPRRRGDTQGTWRPTWGAILLTLLLPARDPQPSSSDVFHPPAYSTCTSRPV